MDVGPVVASIVTWILNTLPRVLRWARQHRHEPHADELKTAILPCDEEEKFVGRGEEWRTIRRAAAGPADRVRIVVIVGAPGGGKTQLARYVAGRMDGRFCAQLHLDLRGDAHDSDRLTTEQALTSLLEMADIRGPELPNDLVEQRRCWQERTKGHQILLLLDDVHPSVHLPDLLPSGRGSLVLVTSRTLPSLAGYHRTKLQLDGLPREVIGTVFKAAGGQLRRGDRRRLVKADVRVPLAVKLIAGATRPPSSPRVAELVTALGGDPGVERAFTVAYERLPECLAAFLRQLSLHPGTGALQLDPGAAEALTDNTIEEARGHLTELQRRSLIRTLADLNVVRYALHEQVRTLARVFAEKEPDGGRSTVERVCEYYQQVALAVVAPAGRQLVRHDRVNLPPTWSAPTCGPRTGPAVTAEDLEAGRRAAVQWYERERANLLACLRFAHEHEWDACAVGLTDALAGPLRNGGPWEVAVRLHDQAAAAALRLADRPGIASAERERYLLARATALNDGGITRRLMGSRHLSIASHRLHEAHALFDDLDNDLGRANARHELGIVETDQARAALQGRGMPKRNPTAARGHLDRAEAFLTEALTIYSGPALREGIGKANAAKNLGVNHYLRGLADNAPDRYQKAEVLFNDALAHYERIHDRLGVAEVSNLLGRLLLEAGGGRDDARRHFEEARTLALRTSSPLELARAYEGLGDCCQKTAGTNASVAQRARECYRQALNEYTKIGSVLSTSEVRVKLED